MEKLRERWQKLCQRLGAKAGISEVFSLLTALYTDPGREYHNDAHLEVCFNEFDRVRNGCDHPDETELALFFHDSIYNSRSNSNECNSAEFASIMMGYMGIRKTSRTIVSALVLDTRHDRKPGTRDGMIICDCDIAIMGYSWEVFEQLSNQIRKEYSWVPEDAGKVMRLNALKGFLERENIFLTESFCDKYEAQARSNIELAISGLKLP